MTARREAVKVRDMAEHSSARISPTAHYTGYVWYRNGLGHPALTTRSGRVLTMAMQPVERAARLAGWATLEDALLWRHTAIDRLLERAVANSGVTQIVEIAAGLSPRGMRFAERYGSSITYLEADLPGMAGRKRKALAAAGVTLGDHHDVITIDALAETGDDSLSQVISRRLDPQAGLAIVTEGLVNYFDRDTVGSMWKRFAEAIRGCGGGVYLSDLYLQEELGRIRGMRAMSAAVSLFARGRVHYHFRDDDELRKALERAGFATGRIHAATADSGKGAVPGRIIEAGYPTME